MALWILLSKKTAKNGDAFLGGSCDRQAVRDFWKTSFYTAGLFLGLGGSELWRYIVWWLNANVWWVVRGWGVGVSGMGGCGIMCISEFSSFIDPDSFGIIPVHRSGFLRNYYFSAKNIPFKTGWFQKFQIQWLGHLCFKDKLGENIPFKISNL